MLHSVNRTVVGVVEPFIGQSSNCAEELNYIMTEYKIQIVYNYMMNSRKREIKIFSHLATTHLESNFLI